MTMMLEPGVPSAEEVRLAKESSRKLASVAAEAVRVEVEGGEVVALPKGAVQVLMKVLEEMGKGNGVSLVPVHALMTTQEAADLIGVSRPFLIKEMEEGRLAYQMAGTHRRVALADAVKYREMCRRRHDKAMDELVRMNQELGLGYQS